MNTGTKKFISLQREQFIEDKRINNLVCNIEKWDIQNNLNNHVLYNDDSVVFTYMTYVEIISRDLWTKICNRISLRNSLTPSQKISCKKIASILLQKFGYITLMNHLYTKLNMNETDELIIDGNNISVSLELFIDIVNQYQHYKDDLYYYIYGDLITPFD